MNIPLPPPIDRRLRVFIVGLAIASTLGCVLVFVLSLWDKSQLGYIDIPLHFVGGAIAGMAFIVVSTLLLPRTTLSTIPRGYMFLCTICFVALVTVLWEIFELFMDTYVGTTLQISTAETIKDMVVGLAGGLCAAFCWPVSSHDT